MKLLFKRFSKKKSKSISQKQINGDGVTQVQIGIVNNYDNRIIDDWMNIRADAIKYCRELRTTPIMDFMKEKSFNETIAYEYNTKDTELTIYTTRPGIWIGPRGREVNRLREILKENFGHDVEVNIKEIKFYSGGFLHYGGDEYSRYSN